MMNFLQAGTAAYVLAAICIASIVGRLMAGSFYKRLMKESTNMALTKNKALRGLKQNAENTYRINQGMNNTRAYIERQLYGFRMMGISIRGLDTLSGQLTLLCFLAGGAAAFASYWYRMDKSFIVLYGSLGILSGLLSIFVDYGVNIDGKRQQLLTCIQDYMENALWPRMARDGSAEPVTMEEVQQREPAPVRSLARERRVNKRSLDQVAASREKVRERVPVQEKAVEKEKSSPGDDWLKELNPEQKRVLGEIFKEFIS